jgi:hypothetical protein
VETYDLPIEKHFPRFSPVRLSLQIPPELPLPVFPLYCFSGSFMPLYHLRWQPTLEVIVWPGPGGAGFEPGIAASQSGAQPLNHLISNICYEL